jgi:hypothetical protein
MTEKTIEGGCLCGATRYRAEGSPLALTLCHCRSCRRAAGAASLAWVVLPSDRFEFQGAEPGRYESSPGIERTFCSTCGTPLTHRRKAAPEKIDVTTGSLDSPNDFPPAKEICVSEKLDWEALNNALPHFPESSRKA